MNYNFGHAIARDFFVLSGNEYIQLPAQSPTIYLFDEMPTLAMARAGTGAVQTVTTWTESEAVTPFTRSYSFTAIADSDPTSSTNEREYWEALNFIEVAAGTVQTVIRSFVVERPEAHDAVITTTYEDVKLLWTQIGSYYSDSQLTDFISVAVDEFKLDLMARELDWGRVQSLDLVRIPIGYKTLAIAMRGQIRRDPTLAELVASFEAEYETKLAGIKLPVNENNDGEIKDTPVKPNFIRFAR